ncbi:unnamed protein product [Aspergillus oryzae var. brunneus]|uniref:Unnamed protein product n=2 Tax=Aspergillus oryzae TaxID=5062 RepID=A0AAN5BZ16_ASPOZ|nr:unnamed protein product [Aspergillus oryzae]GMG47771.1 unnamed protein product [Aspergillus oryzae var. brunneus]
MIPVDMSMPPVRHPGRPTLLGFRQDCPLKVHSQQTSRQGQGHWQAQNYHIEETDALCSFERLRCGPLTLPDLDL